MSTIQNEQAIVLPEGIRSSDHVSFDGTPPKITRVDLVSKIFAQQHVGLYAQTLLVPGCEFSFISDTWRLESDLLQVFEPLERTLILRKFPISGPPMWTVTLPTTPVGVVMKGFPPVIHAVDLSSEWRTFIRPGLTVDRLVIPDVCDLTLASGGFTADRVMKTLHETEHVKGRRLVLIDIVPIGKTRQDKDRTDLFDVDGCCVIT